MQETAKTTQAENVLRTLSDQMANAVERVAPVLVLVNGREQQAASGVVYAPGLVLTASHVIERENNLTVQTYEHKTLPAQLVGRDQRTDVALLRVSELEGESLIVATLAEEQARVGQLVLAVGRPSGDGVMASTGIVSTVNGSISDQHGIVLERSLSTDAIPYPGFSGGALINVEGAVLGILTTRLIRDMTLAIPMQFAKTIADTLAARGRVQRGYLGIGSQLTELPEAQRAGRTQEQGLLIVRVEENGPAQKGGLLVGDILVGLDGQVMKDAEDLFLFLVGDSVGKTVAVEVIRGDKLQTLQVVVGERPSRAA